MVNSEEQKLSKKRNRGHNKRIGFTEEIVTRDVAENLLSQELKENASDAKTFQNKLDGDSEVKVQPRKPKKRKHKDMKEREEVAKEGDTTTDNPEAKKKKRKKEAPAEPDINENVKSSEESEVGKSDKSMSKRALKRAQYQQLLHKKKEESEIESQQKALNYLSKWKYSRSEWKFEKLRQVWLVHNLFNTSKIDEKYWDTVVEYLNNSQGKVREKIIAEAIKIVEDEEIELNDQTKFKRAKDIVQCIQ